MDFRQVASLSVLRAEVMTVNMAASACERSGRWEEALWILSRALGLAPGVSHGSSPWRL